MLKCDYNASKVLTLADGKIIGAAEKHRVLLGDSSYARIHVIYTEGIGFGSTYRLQLDRKNVRPDDVMASPDVADRVLKYYS